MATTSLAATSMAVTSIAQVVVKAMAVVVATACIDRQRPDTVAEMVLG